MADELERKRRDERSELDSKSRKRIRNTPYVNIGKNYEKWNECKKILNGCSDEKLAEVLLNNSRLSKSSQTPTANGNENNEISSPDIEFKNSADSESDVAQEGINSLLDNRRYSSNFEEIEKLGRGGFGSLYKSRNKIDGLLYAVKKIRFTNSKPEDLEKVQREATYLAKLQHTNIVQYNTAWLAYYKEKILKTVSGTSLSSSSMRCDDEEYIDEDTGDKDNVDKDNGWYSDVKSGGVFAEMKSNTKSTRTDKTEEIHDLSKARPQTCSTPQDRKKAVLLYIQMELCSQTLMEWMGTRTEVNLADNMSICGQILSAVNYMHCEGVIHRDLKPINIFLMEGLHVKVGDFGLAKEDLASAIAASPAHSESSPALSTTGSIQSDHTSGIGTKIYAAPEQLAGRSYNFKCDIYSLGVIFFELFNSFLTEMERHERLKELRKGNIPDKFRNDWPTQTDLVVRMTSENPEGRPSAGEILSQGLFSKIEINKTANTETNKTEVIEELRKRIERLELELKEKDELLKQKDMVLSRQNSRESFGSLSTIEKSSKK